MTASRPAPVAASLQVLLLGPFEIRDATGRQIVLRSSKAILLLAFLALSADRAHSRERLISLLWSDRSERQGRASLRQALWELRAAIGAHAPDPLHVDGQTIALARGAVTVDAARFLRLIETGTPETLAKAVALYRGDLLESVPVRDPVFEDYLALERERFRDLALSALDRLMCHQLETAPETALDTARRLLVLDELHEGAHRAVMRLHASRGQADLALRQYRLCRDALARELDVAPRSETQALAEAIRRSAGQPPPPASPPVATPDPHRWRRTLLITVAAASLTTAVAVPTTVSWWWSSGESAAVAPAYQAPLTKPVVGLEPIPAPDDDAEGAALAELIDVKLSSGLRVAGLAASLSRNASPEAHPLGSPRLAVQGRIARREDGLGLTLSVLDAEDGSTVWSNRYDGAAATSRDREVSGTRLADDVVAVVKAYARAMRATSSTDAAVAFVDGWHHYRRHEARAVGHFERALRRDPEFALAHAALAKFYWRCWRHRCASPDLSRWFEAWERAETHLQKAREFGELAPLTHQVASQMLSQQGRHEEAVEEARKAVALDPEDADSRAALAEALTLAGRPREALGELDRLPDGLPSAKQLRALGRARFAGGRLEEAAQALEQAAMRDPQDIAVLELLTSVYGHLDLAEEARKARTRLIGRFDEMTGGLRYRLSIAEFRSSSQLSGDRALFLAGLRQAGVAQ